MIGTTRHARVANPSEIGQKITGVVDALVAESLHLVQKPHDGLAEAIAHDRLAHQPGKKVASSNVPLKRLLAVEVIRNGYVEVESPACGRVGRVAAVGLFFG